MTSEPSSEPSSEPRSEPAVPASAAAPAAAPDDDEVVQRMPWRFRAVRKGGTLRVSRRWISFPQAFMATVIVAFFGPWTALLARMDGLTPKTLLFSATVIVALHWLLVTVFNKTTFTMDAKTLSVRHGPIPWPWPRPVVIDRRELLRVDTVARESRTGAASYAVIARLRHGAEVDLVSNLYPWDHANAIEHIIEQELGVG